ncbi:glycosyltransferase family 32 protein [Macrolepiota fuliginosa MF-IS2]|uniref:Glycosyltransferase family 32 protein n=1 Tax=Macrolepiota fuliginosa MF-IS2 TaxID=1400762 RepID=A0A9P5XMT6_9AGAR|nr:glycosyltransferase family 32 protein [Macrolepiota fuliginosa MF-IS2]
MSSFSDYIPGRTRIQRASNGLPVHTNGSSAVQEKLALNPRHSSWWLRLSLPIPFVRLRPLRIVMLNPRKVHEYTTRRFGRKRGCSMLVLLMLLAFFFVFALARRFGTHAKQWPLTKDSRTLVYGREDLQRIWRWEIASGHYPSRRGIPEQIRLKDTLVNPALPPRKMNIPSPLTGEASEYVTTTRGRGPERIYLDIQSRPPNVAYPPRPVPGSVADLDIVMEHCDFSRKKFVRDCLEVLRVGAGLDNGKRLRRGKLDDWKYIYVEKVDNTTAHAPLRRHAKEEDDLLEAVQSARPRARDDSDPDSGLFKRRGAELEQPPINLPLPVEYKPYASLPHPCDIENPRLFHMFWTGPFTDKPYLAILSFLFTQNTGLHVKRWPESAACRPKFLLWINPGPAAAVPNPNAVKDMFEQLKANPWASPFLHPRFKDVVEFRLWNTTEQLDGVPELRDEWRSRDLFNSGGNVINVNKRKTTTSENETETDARGKDDMMNRTGSKSASTYDRLSVILSDMVRFILCHRYGGIYLDADTIFLRDWEELWGWKGAFAYRWSRMTRYNTAVLKLNKGSALGKFLFRTALKNNLDFHPMTVSVYTREAYLEGLLLRLPDALFDSAWLNTENYQLSRPPQPFFTNFEHFFNTPITESAAPQALGFEGFFRGAFSYHFHNFWWKPFDPARNWPDLGPEFKDGERIARAALHDNTTNKLDHHEEEEDGVEQDRRDLDWATVLKRTFESYIRGERPNMYGEWLVW